MNPPSRVDPPSRVNSPSRVKNFIAFIWEKLRKVDRVLRCNNALFSSLPSLKLEEEDEELGWESLSDRRWGHRMALYYKIVNGLTPAYLFEHVPSEAPRNLRAFIPKAPLSKTLRYDNSFFPFCINQWNTLDEDIKPLLPLKTSKPISTITFDRNPVLFVAIGINMG